MRKKGNMVEYWFADQHFAEMCGHSDPDGVRKELATQGRIVTEGRNLKAKRTLPNIGSQRVTVYKQELPAPETQPQADDFPSEPATPKPERQTSTGNKLAVV
jgi:hypothetical protein